MRRPARDRVGPDDGGPDALGRGGPASAPPCDRPAAPALARCSGSSPCSSHLLRALGAAACAWGCVLHGDQAADQLCASSS